MPPSCGLAPKKDTESVRRKKIFRTSLPNILNLPSGDIDVSGLDELRDILYPVEDVYIEKRKRRDKVFGRYYVVKGVVLPFYAPGIFSEIGITNFYEES